MTARKPAGRPCHVDEDLAHVATTPDEEVRPCSRRHRPVPTGAHPPKGLLPRTRVRLLPDPPKAPKAPPSPTPPARSTPKRAKAKAAPRKARQAYTDAERLAALDTVVESGIAEAHRRHKVPKATLSRWARDAGIDLEAQARARTAGATAAVEAKAAEVKVTTVARLERILEDQLATLEAIGVLERRAVELAVDVARAGDPAVRVSVGDRAGNLLLRALDSELGNALGLVELTTTSVAKRDVVGAATRAVHDLALLKGEATERGAILVRFGIPRPDAAAADASAVDEVDLSRGVTP